MIYRGGSTKVGALSLASILPRTNEYITYEVRDKHAMLFINSKNVANL